MISALARFVAELRRQGLAVSPAEWLDAVRAVERMGLENREGLRVALRSTLVKRAHQRVSFERVFAGFFAAPARGAEKQRSPGEHAAGRERGGAAIVASPTTETSRPAVTPRTGRARELQRRLARTQDGPRRGGERLRSVVLAPRSTARVPSEPCGAQATELRQRLTPLEEAQIAREVRRSLEQIRLRAGRRLRRSARGRLYLRRLFRENLSTGGVPFRLPRRQIRPRRSKVVLLIDVSWSCARAAGLFLSLAHEFLSRAVDTRVLFFVDRALDVGRPVEAWIRGASDVPERGSTRGRPRPGSGIERGGVSFAALLESLPGLNLDAPSDYGRAFGTLQRSPLRPSGTNTVLLILGDGRTNRLDPQGWCLEEIAGRCAAVLWLVPEAFESWGSGDSALGAYLPHTDVAVEARDLNGLVRGVEQLLRRI